MSVFSSGKFGYAIASIKPNNNTPITARPAINPMVPKARRANRFMRGLDGGALREGEPEVVGLFMRGEEKKGAERNSKCSL